MTTVFVAQKILQFCNNSENMVGLRALRAVSAWLCFLESIQIALYLGWVEVSTNFYNILRVIESWAHITHLSDTIVHITTRLL